MYKMMKYYDVLQDFTRIVTMFREFTRCNEITRDIIFYELQREITRYYKILRDIIFYEIHFARCYEMLSNVNGIM